MEKTNEYAWFCANCLRVTEILNSMVVARTVTVMLSTYRTDTIVSANLIQGKLYSTVKFLNLKLPRSPLSGGAQVPINGIIVNWRTSTPVDENPTYQELAARAFE